MLSIQEKQNIQLVWAGMGAILENKNEAKVTASFAEDFIQHNPWAKDGIEHVKEMLQFDFDYKPIRWIADGNIMAYHGYYTAPNPLGDYPLLCVDVWRIENDKIQEHWDVLAPMPEDQLQKVIAGGGDGEKEVSKAERIANKNTVRRFLDHVLNRGRLDLIDELVNEEYVFHQATEEVINGKEALKAHLSKKEGGRRIHDNKLLLGSGDLVMAHSHYFGADERVAFDWFRLNDQNQIVEHWNAAQAITPLEEVANAHPHF